MNFTTIKLNGLAFNLNEDRNKIYIRNSSGKRVGTLKGDFITDEIFDIAVDTYFTKQRNLAWKAEKRALKALSKKMDLYELTDMAPDHVFILKGKLIHLLTDLVENPGDIKYDLECVMMHDLIVIRKDEYIYFTAKDDDLLINSGFVQLKVVK